MQKALEFLQKYKGQTEQILEQIWNQERERAKKIDLLNLKAIDYLADLAKQGKRIRGGLTLLGYMLSGKSSNPQILKASLSLEIFHTSILIHDDIIDKDHLRRGLKTAHIFFSDIAPEELDQDSKKHFGISQAINLGDYGILLSLKTLIQTDFPKQIKQKAFSEFINILQDVVHGQILDCTKTPFEKLSPEHILRIFEYKTARYTGILPLRLGLILSDCKDQKKLEAAQLFGSYLGFVFQIKDDILGVFGDPKKIGKPIGSDIKEGKNTFFLYYIAKYGSKKEKEFLQKYLGKQDLAEKEILAFQKFFKKTGALDFVEQKLEEYKQKALKICKSLTQEQDLQDLLKSFLTLASEREK